MINCQILNSPGSYLPEENKASCFRLSAAFDGQEPALDGLRGMRRMERDRNRVENENKLEIAESLIAKQFYFELEGALRLIGD